MSFKNVYDDAERARAYAGLEYPGTYFLAYRDLPSIIGSHAVGSEALDFGCGAGRSTRFLRELGFEVTGVDISPDMIALARAKDNLGDYRLIADGDFSDFESASFDVILCAFTFDNIPTMSRKVGILRELRRTLKPQGCIVNLVSSPDIYINEWASFGTRDFPENRQAKSGDTVKIVMKDVEDCRPVLDIVWSHEDYLETYRQSGLTIAAEYRPLGWADEPVTWVSETTIAPWVIYVARAT